jgi:hypothetical protein
MAAKADDPTRIDLALRSIESILDELSGLTQGWPGLTTDERIAWSLEWGNEMAKLRQLAETEAAGRLDSQQSERFRALAERTVSQLPLIKMIDLRAPDERVLVAGRVKI